MSGGREGTYYFLSTATVKVNVVTLDGQPTETQLHVLVYRVYTVKSRTMFYGHVCVEEVS